MSQADKEDSVVEDVTENLECEGGNKLNAKEHAEGN